MSRGSRHLRNSFAGERRWTRLGGDGHAPRAPRQLLESMRLVGPGCRIANDHRPAYVVDISSALRKACEVNDARVAFAVLQSAKERELLTEKILQTGLAACNRRGHCALALQLVEAVPDLLGEPASMRLRTAALGACSRTATDIIRAVEIYDQMVGEGADLDLVAKVAVLTALGRVGQWRRALALLQNPDEAPREVVNACIAALDQSGRWREAVELLHRLRSRHAADGVSFSSAVSACAKAGQADAALDLLKLAPVSEIVYGAAISACEKGDRPYDALRLLSEMSGLGLRRDLPACNSALSACSKMGWWAEGIEIVKQMNEDGVTRSRATCNAFIKACEVAGQYDVAADALCRYFPIQEERDSIETAGCVTRTYREAVAARLERRAAMPARERIAPIGRQDIHISSKFDSVIQHWVLQHPPVDLRVQISSVRDALTSLVSEVVPSATLHPYGSAVEGTALSSSDVDFTICVDEDDAALREALDSALRGRPFQDQVLRHLRSAVASSRGSLVATDLVLGSGTPVMRLTEKGVGVGVDVTVNGHEVLKKTELIGRYTRHPVVRDLTRLVKAWAKSRQLYGYHLHHLTGFGYALMVIDFVQARYRVPVLSARCNDEIDLAGTTLTTLFVEFCSHFSLLSQSGEPWSVCITGAPRAGSIGGVMSVEDPIEEDVDLGAAHLTAQTSETLFDAMRKVVDAAQNGSDPFV